MKNEPSLFIRLKFLYLSHSSFIKNVNTMSLKHARVCVLLEQDHKGLGLGGEDIRGLEGSHGSKGLGS